MVKSPIDRVGGKSRLAKHIRGHFPEHDIYIEVFFGAGHIFFSKEPVKLEVVNDIDGELVNLFRVIRFHPDEFEKVLSHFLHSRQMFSEIELEPHLTDVQRAVNWYFKSRVSFASMGGNFGYGRTPKRSGIPLLRRDFAAISTRMERL